MTIDAAELANLTRGIDGEDVLALELSDGRTVTIPQPRPGDTQIITLLIEAMLSSSELSAALQALGVRVS